MHLTGGVFMFTPLSHCPVCYVALVGHADVLSAVRSQKAKWVRVSVRREGAIKAGTCRLRSGKLDPYQAANVTPACTLCHEGLYNKRFGKEACGVPKSHSLVSL